MGIKDKNKKSSINKKLSGKAGSSDISIKGQYGSQNDASCTCSSLFDTSFPYKQLPPPAPPDGRTDLWELQFCRWWGWNWVKKKDRENDSYLDVEPVDYGTSNFHSMVPPGGLQREPSFHKRNASFANEARREPSSNKRNASFANQSKQSTFSTKEHLKTMCNCILGKKSPMCNPNSKLYNTPSASKVNCSAKLNGTCRGGQNPCPADDEENLINEKVRKVTSYSTSAEKCKDKKKCAKMKRLCKNPNCSVKIRCQTKPDCQSPSDLTKKPSIATSLKKSLSCLVPGGDKNLNKGKLKGTEESVEYLTIRVPGPDGKCYFSAQPSTARRNKADSYALTDPLPILQAKTSSKNLQTEYDAVSAETQDNMPFAETYINLKGDNNKTVRIKVCCCGACSKQQQEETVQTRQSQQQLQGLGTRQSQQQLQGLGTRQSQQQLQGLETRQSLQQLQELETRQSQHHLQGLQTSQSQQQLQGLQTRQSQQQLQGLQTRRSQQQLEGLQTRQSLQQLQGLQTRQSQQQLQGLQTRPSQQQLRTVQRKQSHHQEQTVQTTPSLLQQPLHHQTVRIRSQQELLEQQQWNQSRQMRSSDPCERTTCKKLPSKKASMAVGTYNDDTLLYLATTTKTLSKFGTPSKNYSWIQDIGSADTTISLHNASQNTCDTIDKNDLSVLKSLDFSQADNENRKLLDAVCEALLQDESNKEILGKYIKNKLETKFRNIGINNTDSTKRDAGTTQTNSVKTSTVGVGVHLPDLNKHFDNIMSKVLNTLSTESIDKLLYVQCLEHSAESRKESKITRHTSTPPRELRSISPIKIAKKRSFEGNEVLKTKRFKQETSPCRQRKPSKSKQVNPEECFNYWKPLCSDPKKKHMDIFTKIEDLVQRSQKKNADILRSMGRKPEIDYLTDDDCKRKTNKAIQDLDYDHTFSEQTIDLKVVASDTSRELCTLVDNSMKLDKLSVQSFCVCDQRPSTSDSFLKIDKRLWSKKQGSLIPVRKRSSID